MEEFVNQASVDTLAIVQMVIMVTIVNLNIKVVLVILVETTEHVMKASMGNILRVLVQLVTLDTIVKCMLACAQRHHV